MTLQQLVSDSMSPVKVIGSTTGKVLKNNVTTKTLERNPQLATLQILGIQSTFTTSIVCWVDETEFNSKK